MRRREFMALASGAVVGLPLVSHAQQLGNVPVIGFLGAASPGPYAPFVAGFVNGLNEAGFVDGKNVTVIYRWAEGKYDRLPALANELVAHNVALIMATGGLPSSLAAKAATTSIPIVFTLGADPVTFDLVASLNHPGGNITGVVLYVYLLHSKLLELAHELVPDAAIVAMLVNPDNPPETAPQLTDVVAAARAIGAKLIVLNATRENDFDAAFATLEREKARVLLVSADAFFLSKRDHLVALAASHAVPTIYGFRQFVEANGLMSYGVSLVDSYRQAGGYAARILRGEKVADLPVLQPTKFELVVNLKTAKTLGLAVPQSILARADELIE
jgi:putative tryptophan/tyrosine transport system substrate-binding protein